MTKTVKTGRFEVKKKTVIKSPFFAIFEDRKCNPLKTEHVINDVEMRTRVFPLRLRLKTSEVWILTIRTVILRESVDETALADFEGTQPYLFEHYESEARSSTNSNESNDWETFDRLQNTDW